MIGARTIIRGRQVALRFSRRLWADRSGLALLEFALVLPILILLTFGGAELANLAIAHARVSAITSMVADGTARVRDSIDENDINDILTGATYSGDNLSLTSRGRIIISTVEDNAATATPTDDQVITWQRCKGTKNVAAANTIGIEGAVLTAAIGSTGRQIRATPGNPIVVVQIFYDYRPVMSDAYFGPITMSYTSAFSVRDRTIQSLQNAQGLSGTGKSTCNYFTA